MGSYDTSETYTPPPRRTFSGGGTGSGGGSRRTPPAIGGGGSVPPASTPPPQSDYDPSLPSIVALGGGLTPSRIVKKVPDEVKEGKLIDVINYMIRAEVTSTKEEIAIAEAVRQRMGAADYRGIINQFYNYHNEKLRTDDLSTYLQRKERQTEEGTTHINFCDIAIVSHDEGGKDLDEILI